MILCKRQEYQKLLHTVLCESLLMRVFLMFKSLEDFGVFPAISSTATISRAKCHITLTGFMSIILYGLFMISSRTKTHVQSSSLAAIAKEMIQKRVMWTLLWKSLEMKSYALYHLQKFRKLDTEKMSK